MNKKIFFGFLVLLLLVQFIVAAETEINIKTLPSHEVQIVIHDGNSGTFALIERTEVYSDGYGNAQLITNINQEFKLKVYISDLNHNKVYGDSFSTIYSPGEEVYLEVAPSGFSFIEAPEKPEVAEEVEENVNTTEEVVEEVIAELTIEENNQTENEPGIMGNVISDVKDALFKPLVLYIIGGIILLIIILLITFKLIRSKKPKANKEIIIRKLSELDNKKDDIDENNDDVKRLEDKLKSIQEEIAHLRQKGDKSAEELEAKIAETKKKIREDEERLIKLRSQKK